MRYPRVLRRNTAEGSRHWRSGLGHSDRVLPATPDCASTSKRLWADRGKDRRERATHARGQRLRRDITGRCSTAPATQSGESSTHTWIVWAKTGPRLRERATPGRTKPPRQQGFREVGATGLEPVTPSLSISSVPGLRGSEHCFKPFPRTALGLIEAAWGYETWVESWARGPDRRAGPFSWAAAEGWSAAAFPIRAASRLDPHRPCGAGRSCVLGLSRYGVRTWRQFVVAHQR